MPSRESDAVVLRTYPYGESNLIVSFYARDRGKLRGVAYRARHPKSNFGVALQRLARSRILYVQRENRDLVTLQRADLAGPSNLWKADYATSIVLDVIAEVADRLVPESQRPKPEDDAYFRLLALIAEEFEKGIDRRQDTAPMPPWAQRALVYFLLWSARLGGWLPPLDRCSETERAFGHDEPAFFAPNREGLVCADFKGPDSWRFSDRARELATAMLRNRVDRLPEGAWHPSAASVLQRFLVQRTQAQLGDRLRGANSLHELCRE